mgnify:FL=1
MLSIKEINQKAKSLMLKDMKLPSGISNPVIREMNGQYYISYFSYVYGKQNIQEKKYNRPNKWIIVDIKTGELIAEYNCNENDFSQASFDKLYSMYDPDVKKPSEEYFLVMDNLFDTVRASIVFGKKIDEVTYKAYLENLYAITPREYITFYKDLSYKRGNQ